MLVMVVTMMLVTMTMMIMMISDDYDDDIIEDYCDNCVQIENNVSYATHFL